MRERESALSPPGACSTCPFWVRPQAYAVRMWARLSANLCHTTRAPTVALALWRLRPRSPWHGGRMGTCAEAPGRAGCNLAPPRKGKSAFYGTGRGRWAVTPFNTLRASLRRDLYASPVCGALRLELHAACTHLEAYRALCAARRAGLLGHRHSSAAHSWQLRGQAGCCRRWGDANAWARPHLERRRCARAAEVYDLYVSDLREYTPLPSRAGLRGFHGGPRNTTTQRRAPPWLDKIR